MSKTKKMELRELATGVMDVVTIAACRRLEQVLEMIHEEYIAPRDKRIAELEAELARLRASGG